MSTVSNIKDGLQVALELANAANKSEAVAKLIETQQQILQVLDENRHLRDRVTQLEDELAMDSQLLREGFRYYVLEATGDRTGPVCPGCYKRERVVSQVVESSLSSHFCQRCQESFQF